MPYKKILIIQTAFIGDAILTSPLIRAMRRQFPDAEIDLIANAATRALFELNPNLNRVFPFIKKPFFAKIINFVRLLFLLWREKYECAVSVQSYMTSANLMYFGRIPRRVGFKRQKLLTDPIVHGGLMHRTEYYLSLMKAFTGEKFDRQTEVFWTDEEERAAQKLIASHRTGGQFLLGMAPGSMWFTKRWPQEYFVDLIDQLGSENIKIVLLGGPGEKKLCREIEQQSQNEKIRNIAGNYSITGSAAIIAKLDLMLVNDSAPLHLANAAKTDVVAIFGPTVRRYGFYPMRENDTMLERDLSCSPCRHNGGPVCPEGHFKCMRDLPPDDVLQTILKYFRRKQDGKHLNS